MYACDCMSVCLSVCVCVSRFVSESGSVQEHARCD